MRDVAPAKIREQGLAPTKRLIPYASSRLHSAQPFFSAKALS